jgi:cation diffusion facilitator CzcD-associated flavoprotein CzcO
MKKPTKKSPSIVIIGTGFAGLCMGIRFKQVGLDSFTILERAQAVGGTWRDNTYPGAACDVPSHLYSFSFEPNPRWTRQFAPQAEILDYLHHCTDKYGLGPHLRFNSPVSSARFDESAGEWVLTVGDGEELRADIVVSGCGGLSRPSLPQLPGLADFQGKVFHSARWDHGHDLSDKTVAVIGTGASAIQIVPEIAPRVRKLHLFQRTPPWILPKDDRAIGERERKLYEALPSAQWLHRQLIYWRLESRAPLFTRAPSILKLAERLALRFLEQSIPDPTLRAKLTPDYVFGCKRVLLSNDFYPALNRPNVELVTDGIREVTREGLVTREGTARPVDTIILATGFQAAEAASPFPIRGRGGLQLEEAWRASAEAYLGTSVAGLPNLFFLAGPNTGLGHSSMVFMLESQVQYVLDCIQTLQREGLGFLEVRKDVQERFNQRLHERLARTVWNVGGCASWYRTSNGKNTTLWPGSTLGFRWRTRRLALADYHVGRPRGHRER